MSNGDLLKITKNVSGHCIPIGTLVLVINVTDDEYKVWYGGRFHWVTDDDFDDENFKSKNTKYDV